MTGDNDAAGLVATLRTDANSSVTGLSGLFQRLDDLGISTNGQNNTLSLTDEGKFDAALSNNLSSVKQLFLDPTNGIATRLSTFLTGAVGDSGSVTTKLANLSKQSSDIDTRVADMERLVQDDIQRMNAGFVAMETSDAATNQELAYLQKQFP